MHAWEVIVPQLQLQRNRVAAPAHAPIIHPKVALHKRRQLCVSLSEHAIHVMQDTRKAQVLRDACKRQAGAKNVVFDHHERAAVLQRTATQGAIVRGAACRTALVDAGRRAL